MFKVAFWRISVHGAFWRRKISQHNDVVNVQSCGRCFKYKGTTTSCGQPTSPFKALACFCKGISQANCLVIAVARHLSELEGRYKIQQT